MNENDKKKVKSFKILGKFEKVKIESKLETEEQDIGTFARSSISELDQLVAFALQSGCSTCSASGSGVCC